MVYNIMCLKLFSYIVSLVSNKFQDVEGLWLYVFHSLFEIRRHNMACGVSYLYIFYLINYLFTYYAHNNNSSP